MKREKNIEKWSIKIIKLANLYGLRKLGREQEEEIKSYIQGEEI